MYDKFLRVLTRVYAEAAGLYGYEDTLRESRATLRDDLDPTGLGGRRVASYLTGLLVAAGAGYVGLRFLTRSRPDTYRKSEP